PPESGDGAGVRESVSDQLDPLRRSRQTAGSRDRARRAAARGWHDRRGVVQPDGNERRRHPRDVPHPRRLARVQPTAEAGSPDVAPAPGMDRRRNRRRCDGARIAGRIRTDAIHETMKATEERLDELRRQAERTGRVDAKGIRATGAPLPEPGAEHGYYGLPLLKPPVWTWEIPLYFFVGGAAGASAMIAVAAQASGANESLVRDARRVALAGAVISAPLLISDLGRPERFLNMLRVFKPQSPMSVGVWTLVAFSTFASAAVFADELQRRTGARVTFVRDACGAAAALAGLGMSTYTGVLLGATAIPAWSQHVNMLPIHFAASAVASASSLLELCGHRHRALPLLASGAAAY